MERPEKLRELAVWYREFAERTGNPTIWDARLRTAEDLEAEASRIEKRLAESVGGRSPPKTWVRNRGCQVEALRLIRRGWGCLRVDNI